MQQSAGEPQRIRCVGLFLAAPNRQATRLPLGELVATLRPAALPWRRTITGRSARPWSLGCASGDSSVFSNVTDLPPLVWRAGVVVVPRASLYVVAAEPGRRARVGPAARRCMAEARSPEPATAPAGGPPDSETECR
jgi:hypothetical protein